jgi:sugar transferase (PEP-CTERM/EpsH1 system associated)
MAELAQPLRVLHVVNRLGMGGTEYGVVKVIHGLDGKLFEHRICATRGYEKDLVERDNLQGRVYVAGSQEAGFQFLIPRLVRIMKDYRPHIVHSRNWGAIEAVVAARLARVPVAIHSEHGYEIEMLNGLSRRKRWVRRAVYAMTDCVFTVSEQLREYHAAQAGVTTRGIRVVPNGVDTNRFAPRPEKRFDLRKRIGLPIEGLVAGTVGRVVAIKGHATLLDAAESLINRGVDVYVLLAGSGPELAGLQERVKNSRALTGRVVFLGATDGVPEVLNAMDAFVLPSVSEGMSNTLLEAMASGLPVLATRVGGNPELVEHGRTGWLFPPGNISELAAHLERLSVEPGLRLRFGDASRRVAVERFSLEKMTAGYQELYLELARRKHVWRGQGAESPCAA